MNAAVSALRFFFGVTLGRDDAEVGMTTVREPRQLPVILSPQEVTRLLNAAPGLKYRAALSVAYGAGLRASEVVSLKVSDIDRERMVIRVEQGKGRTDRYAMLSASLLCTYPTLSFPRFPALRLLGRLPSSARRRQAPAGIRADRRRRPQQEPCLYFAYICFTGCSDPGAFPVSTAVTRENSSPAQVDRAPIRADGPGWRYGGAGSRFWVI